MSMIMVNKCIKGIGVRKTKKFGCSLSLNKDFRKIDIKCVKEVEDTDNVIGIISNIDESKNETWWYQMKGYKYWWQNKMVILSQHNN